MSCPTKTEPTYKVVIKPPGPRTGLSQTVVVIRKEIREYGYTEDRLYGSYSFSDIAKNARDALPTDQESLKKVFDSIHEKMSQTEFVGVGPALATTGMVMAAEGFPTGIPMSCNINDMKRLTLFGFAKAAIPGKYDEMKRDGHIHEPSRMSVWALDEIVESDLYEKCVGDPSEMGYGEDRDALFKFLGYKYKANAEYARRYELYRKGEFITIFEN